MAKYQKVFLRIVGMVGDTTIDTDKLPDRVLAEGEINLKPNIREGAAENTYGPDGIAELELPNPIKCRIVNGMLTYGDDPFVWLRVSEEGWNWNISFTNLRVAGIAKKLDAFNFDLTPATEDQIARGHLEPTDPQYYWGLNLAPLVEFPNPNTGQKTVKGDTGYSIVSVEQVGQDGFRFVTNNPNPLEATLPELKIPLFTQSVNRSEAAAAAALISEGKAKTSETNAGTSAGIASGAATSAATSAGTADTRATASANSATAALSSEGKAKTSETNAKTSETNSKTSENAAKASETAAKTSETAAKASETAAKTSETNAKSSETSASNSKTAAETARTGAEQARDAATSMVVPDGAVTKPKLKTQDHTNMIFGGGFENGIEPQDWVSNTFGANATLDTTPANVWSGTRALKLTGNGEMLGPSIPISPGEVFSFSAMTLVPAALTGAGGLRIQTWDGTAWTDIASSDVTAVPTGAYTRQYILAVAPAGSKAVRWRHAYVLSNWGSGVYLDEFDFRRGVEALPPSIVGTSQLGSKVVNSAKIADDTIGNTQINSAANISQSKIASTGGWVNAALAGKANSTHGHVATEITDSTATGRSVLTATDATAARSAIGAGTSSLTLGTTSTTAARGDDSRLSDTRTPSDSSVTDAKVAAAAAIAMTKLGTGRVIGRRNGTTTSTSIDVLTEAQYQALVTAGTVDPNTLYFRS